MSPRILDRPAVLSHRRLRVGRERAPRYDSSVNRFEQERHKPPAEMSVPPQLVVACMAMRSGVNLSRIVRAAGCFGIGRVVACGSVKIDRKIARDAADIVEVERHRSLPPALAKLRSEGYRLVGLEQATNSTPLPDYEFHAKSVLVVGNEREGLDSETLKLLDDVVEIPIYGRPYSLNAATAAAIGMYEYCRQVSAD